MTCSILGRVKINTETIPSLTIHSHHMLTMLFDGKLYLAPIKEDLQNVLDIGTGTGIWAMYIHISSALC
jgi:ribosomal protein L11 methylase PrmA